MLETHFSAATLPATRNRYERPQSTFIQCHESTISAHDAAFPTSANRRTGNQTRYATRYVHGPYGNDTWHAFLARTNVALRGATAPRTRIHDAVPGCSICIRDVFSTTATKTNLSIL